MMNGKMAPARPGELESILSRGPKPGADGDMPRGVPEGGGCEEVLGQLDGLTPEDLQRVIGRAKELLGGSETAPQSAGFEGSEG